MTAALAFIDTETTGIHVERRAWEIAIIRREPDGRERTLHAFVRDVDLSKADPYGLNVGRFYERHPSYRRTVDDVLNEDPWSGSSPTPDLPRTARVVDESRAAELVERMTRGAHLVGCVPNFDTEVFADMLRRHWLTPAWHHHLIDVEALAVGYINGRIAEARMRQPDVRMPRWESGLGLPWRSDDLSVACGILAPGEAERHTALGDARWAMRLYDAIVTATPAPAGPAAAQRAEAVA